MIAAVAVPYFSHLLGDTITPGGVPWLLPATQRWSISLFRTGQTFERTVLSLLLAATAAVAVWVVLSPPVTADLYTLLQGPPLLSVSRAAK